ncbi:MAG: glycolate oxidase subunit GlcF, partial [Rhodocyclaceae bacterium]|nr:glycolate oxidase subunit GlcF [Rhodocyclaceae bacterium]
GPRGRIYLIKQVLEGAEPTERTRLHLDRCLTCRSCETTCPSGVHYSRLLDIGRAVVTGKVPRQGADALTRAGLRTLLPRPRVFGPLMRLGQAFRGLMPAALAAKIHPRRPAKARPAASHRRRVLMLEGCVQPSMMPNVNAAAARVLDRLGISVVPAAKAGCCGAVSFHLDEAEAAREAARRNIDAWWPAVEAGAEAIVMTASGCGVHVRDYAHLLQEDRQYALKAARVALLTRDVSEVVAAEATALRALLAQRRPAARRVAFHSPCTLQHGQKIRGLVEELLAAAGADLAPVADAHLCCGSAGTYSVLQEALSLQLRGNKLAALGAGRPAEILSANVGCIAHLQAGTALPVRHWIEFLEESLESGPATDRPGPGPGDPSEPRRGESSPPPPPGSGEAA